MPTEPYKPIIFISYAHADEPEKPAEGEIKWLSFVTGYLRPAVKQGAVEIWVDWLMPGGADWEREIGSKLRACDIFILLVSRHSLSSDYVVDKEIAIIRERQAKGEDVHFYPLVLTPTPKIALDLVRDKNLRPRDGKPFSDYSLNDRYRHMSKAADEIAEIAGEIASRKHPHKQLPQHETAGSYPTGSQIDDEESLRNWLSEQSRDVAVAIAARAALRLIPQPSLRAARSFASLVSGSFRATALAWVASKYWPRANKVSAAAHRAGDAVRAAGHNLDLGGAARVISIMAAVAAEATSNSTRAGIAMANSEPIVAKSITDAFIINVSAAVALAAATFDYSSIWEEIRADVAAFEKYYSHEVADLPLWADGAPEWADQAWAILQEVLPEEGNWEVWTDGTISACSVDRAASHMKSFSLPCHLKCGRGDQRRRTSGYASICRKVRKPQAGQTSPNPFPISTLLSLTPGTPQPG